LKHWDTQKKTINRMPHQAPLNSFIVFYHGLKLMAKLLGI